VAEYTCYYSAKNAIAYRGKRNVPAGVRTKAIQVVENVEKAKEAADAIIGGILRATHATSFQVYNTQKDCFRHELTDTYKANRKDKKKPVFYDEIRTYLREVYKSCFVSGIEADDALGIVHTEDQRNDVSSIVCSIDKDLLNVPGRHFSFVKGTFHDVSAEAARKNFMMQMLMGDTADNIGGIPKVGPVKAQKMLEAAPDGKLGPVVKAAYIEHFGEEEGLRMLALNRKLLWILHEPDEKYPFRSSKPLYDSIPISAFTGGNLAPSQENAASAFK
jgi:DNA polymerase-1